MSQQMSATTAASSHAATSRSATPCSATLMSKQTSNLAWTNDEIERLVFGCWKGGAGHGDVTDVTIWNGNLQSASPEQHELNLTGMAGPSRPREIREHNINLTSMAGPSRRRAIWRYEMNLSLPP
ncbi:hypothetical protein BDZ91DRAFT_784517, partial [Kalaharituber pfeilii]